MNGGSLLAVLALGMALATPGPAFCQTDTGWSAPAHGKASVPKSTTRKWEPTGSVWQGDTGKLPGADKVSPVLDKADKEWLFSDKIEGYQQQRLLDPGRLRELLEGKPLTETNRKDSAKELGAKIWAEHIIEKQDRPKTLGPKQIEELIRLRLLAQQDMTVSPFDPRDLDRYKMDKAVLDKPRPPEFVKWRLAAPTTRKPRKPCPQCQEAEPVGATTHLINIGVQTSSVDLRRLGALTQDIASCSSAINGLRLRDLTGRSRIDQDGFERQCLGKAANIGSTALLPQHKQEVSNCFNLYAKFDKSCLYTSTSSLDDDLLQDAGILVRIVPGLPMQILCSGWSVNATTVLSARHCLAKEQLLAPKQTVVGPNAIAFIPYAEATSVSIDPVRQRIGWSVTGEIDRDGKIKPLSYPEETPYIEDDLVLLAVEPAEASSSTSARKARPPVFVPKDHEKGQLLTVIGFQEFVHRAYLVGSLLRNERLPTDESLVATGEWRNFIRVHRSAICRAVPTDRDSIGHYCQTFGRTSGAPIFAIVDSGGSRRTAYLVGVQSRGMEEGETERPNNEAVALKRGSHPYLEKLLDAR